MTRKRKRYTGEEKLAILRKHLLEGIAVVFRRSNDTEAKKLQRQVTQLEEKLVKKNEVLGELLEEYVTLKKDLGAL